MNSKGKFCFFATAMVAMTLFGACSGKKSDNATVADASAADVEFVTDSVSWADSLEFAGCKADVTITGRYPSAGNQQLVDSVRSWVGGCLGQNMWNTDTILFVPDAKQLKSGKALAEACGKALIASAEKDFKGFAGDSIKVDYEYIYNFGSDFSTDKVITYFCTRYGYVGGAHGGTLFNNRTFVAANGKSLSIDNMFRPDVRAKLVKMVRTGLWDQYFKPSADDASMTLRDMLLINPDTLPLPQCPPVFLANGLSFIYQQYEIAPYSAGMPSCVLPYAEVKPLMTPEAAELVP